MGLPPLVAMFNSTGSAYAAERTVGGQRDGSADREPLRAVVQRQRHPGALLDSRGDRRELSHDPLPGSAGALPQRHPHHHRSRQLRRRPARPGQRPPQLDERPDDLHAVHRARRGRAFDRPGDCRARSAADSRFRSLQIGVSQESFGESIQRNMSWAGFDRALPPEMLPDRLFDRLFGRREEGWINRKRSILDTVLEDAAALEEEPAQGRPGARRRAPGVRSRCGARHHQPAARVSPDRSAGVRRHEGLAAHRQAAKRSAGAGADHPADARGFLHAHQVPEHLPLSRGLATRRRGITTTRTPTGGRPAPTASRGSAFCAISAAGTSRSSRTCWAG